MFVGRENECQASELSEKKDENEDVYYLLTVTYEVKI